MTGEPTGYVADACLVAAIRASRRSVLDFLGSIDVVPTLIVIDELLYGLSRDHPIYQANLAVLGQMGPPIRNHPTIVFRANELTREYARHQGPPQERDALIAAAAIEEGRGVITANVSDFHFYEQLWLLDSDGHDPAVRGPLIARQAPRKGAISAAGCSAAIRSDRRRGR